LVFYAFVGEYRSPLSYFHMTLQMMADAFFLIDHGRCYFLPIQSIELLANRFNPWFGVVEAIDFGAHAGMHRRLGVEDHIIFHPSLPLSPSAIRIAPPSESSLPSSAEGEHPEPSIGAEAEQQM